MAQKNILLVEDEPDLVEVLKLRLESDGECYKVTAVNNAEEGITHARASKPDLIILDVMLPQMDGFCACRILKKDEKTKDIPIIMLTVKSQEQDIETGRKAGAAEYVVKPFDFGELLEKVRKHI